MSLGWVFSLLGGGAAFAFALGWAFGLGAGREKYASLVGEQEARLVALAAEVAELEGALERALSAPPGADVVDRVFDVDTGPEAA